MDGSSEEEDRQSLSKDQDTSVSSNSRRKRPRRESGDGETRRNNPKKSRAYCFTLNNWTQDEFQRLRDTLIDQSSYFVIGREVGGTEGTPHLQGYVYFKSPRSFSATLSLMGNQRIHLEIAKGTAEENRRYCTKDNDFEEHGDVPHQGKRTDLSDVAKCIDNGTVLRDVATAFPSQFIKYAKGIKEYSNTTRFKARNSKDGNVCFWLWGKTGQGKSKICDEISNEVFQGKSYWKTNNGKWFDGYEQEKMFIWDDYRTRGNETFGFNCILRLVDRYRLRIESKGGSFEFNSQVIFFTSPFSIVQAFQGTEDEELEQIRRRFHFEFEITEENNQEKKEEIKDLINEFYLNQMLTQ